MRPARNPASPRGAEALDSKTSHAQEFRPAGEEAQPWSEGSYGRLARNQCVREYLRARPAKRHRTHFAAAGPRRTSAPEASLPPVRGQKTPRANFLDRTE